MSKLADHSSRRLLQRPPFFHHFLPYRREDHNDIRIRRTAVAECAHSDRSSRLHGGLNRMRLPMLVVGVKKQRSNAILTLLLLLLATQFFKTYLSMASSPTNTAVPTTGVTTKSPYAIELYPLTFFNPTLPIVASLRGPISNWTLHTADHAIAFARLCQYSLEPPNSCFFARSLLLTNILPVNAPCSGCAM